MTDNASFQVRHIISTRDLSRDDYIAILRKGRKFKYGTESRMRKNFHGQSMALLFYEPSTRTHSTFKEAIRRYGGRADHGFTSATSTSVAKGESLHDTITHYLGLGVNVIIIRHPKDGSAQWAADVADEFREAWGEGRPYVVINGGDGQNEHPTQAAGDVFTIQDELGDWNNIGTVKIGNGLDFLSFGDIRYGRAAKSAIKATHQVFGIKNLYLACHSFVGPTGNMMGEYKKMGIPNIVVVHEPKEFMELLNGNVDVAYGSRIQGERQGKGTPQGDAKLKEIYDSGIQLTGGMVRSPRKHMIVMHPQPFDMHHPVITKEVKNEPFAKWVPESMNHIPTRAGILDLRLFGEDI